MISNSQAATKVDCYDRDGNFIKTYNGVWEVAEQLDIAKSIIYMIMKQWRRKSAKGFVFRRHGIPFKTDIGKKQYQYGKSKLV